MTVTRTSDTPQAPSTAPLRMEAKTIGALERDDRANESNPNDMSDRTNTTNLHLQGGNQHDGSPCDIFYFCLLGCCFAAD